MTPVSFSIFDLSGVPTNAPTPAFVAVKDKLGNTLPQPIIANLGTLGTYAFDMADGGYLISTTSLPPYVAGGVGEDGVYVALYEMTGAPKANATPTVALTDWAGTSISSPGVANLGGGLYFFPVSGPCCYLMTTGCNPEFLTGSVEGASPAPVAPPMPRLAPTTSTVQPGRDIHIDFTTGKFYQYKGDLVLVTGMNAVMQAVLLALNTFMGTYWLDTGYGVDYWNGILGKNRPKELVLAAFRNAILAVEGVLSVPSIEYTLTTSRFCTVSVKVKSNDGVFNLTTSVGA